MFPRDSGYAYGDIRVVVFKLDNGSTNIIEGELIYQACEKAPFGRDANVEIDAPEPGCTYVIYANVDWDEGTDAEDRIYAVGVYGQDDQNLQIFDRDTITKDEFMRKAGLACL